MKHCPKCGCETERFKNGKCKPCGKARCAIYNAVNAQKIKEQRARKYAENPEPAKSRAKEWGKKNYEKKSASNKAWHEKNPDSHKKSVKKYDANNPWVIAVKNQNRRARKAKVGGKLSSGLADKLFKLQRGKCACGCGQDLGSDYHIDHIMPLALGGANEDSNMQLLRPKCNRIKHARHPVDFYQMKGFLL